MNELLAEILEAHGGLDRWNKLERVDATIVSGGGFFPLIGRAAGFKPALHDCLAARGTLVGFPLRRSRSAHDVHSRADRH